VPPTPRELLDVQYGLHVVGGGHGHAQRADAAQPQHNQSRLEVVDLGPEAEQRRIGHLQDLGGEGWIARNECDQFPDLDVVACQQIQQSQYDRWKGGYPRQQSFAVLMRQIRGRLAHIVLFGAFREKH
jgi:hypothetical protein